MKPVVVSPRPAGVATGGWLRFTTSPTILVVDTPS
jgi:hypothetical protein